MRSPLIGAARSEVLGAGTGTGTAVTPGNTVKGSYATIGTAGFDYNAITFFAYTVTRNQRIDVAINTGGADQVIVEDLFLNPLANVSHPGIHLPVFIPSGAVVKVRSQGSSASGVCTVLINGFSTGQGQYPGQSRIRSLTDWTGTAPSNTVTLTGQTYTAYTTIVASSAARASRLWFHAFHSSGTETAGLCLFTLAIGAAASEKDIATLMFQNGGTLPQTTGPSCPIPCDIPSGSRLSFKAQHSQAGATTGVVGGILMGLAA